MVLHLASFWKWGFLELGNDPGEVKTAIKRLQNGKLPVIDSIQGPKWTFFYGRQLAPKYALSTARSQIVVAKNFCVQ